MRPPRPRRKAAKRAEPTEVAREPKGSSKGGRRLNISRQPGERWGHFVQRVANAFGLVLLLVLATYVLGSLTPTHGWTGVLTILVASTAAVIGLAGAEARLVV